MNPLPKLISGGNHKDERGTLIFFNDLDISCVKRLYKIEHPNTEIVRAWQAHKVEQKWFHVINGSFKVVIVQPDDWENPSEELTVQEYILKSADNQVLHIPGNYANGFKALEEGSTMIVFSDLTAEESANDNFRFPPTMWYNCKMNDIINK